MRVTGLAVFRTATIAAAWFAASYASMHARRAPPGDLSAFLQQTIGLNAKQLGALESGQVVAKVLRTPVTRDIVVFGITSVDVPRATFVERFTANPDGFRSPTRSAFGVFGTPASPSDVGDLALSKDDIKDLKACRPRSCNFKLPASSMAFLSSRVDWDAPNVVADLAQRAREQMAAYVTDYRQRGTEAMVVYDDNVSVKSSDALAELLAESPQYSYPSAPAFQRYLLDYPAEKLDSVTTEIFWSRDQMPRTRPIFGIRQLSIFTPPDPGNATLIATKQLWSDHYLEASLDMLSVVDRPPGAAGQPPGGVYLIVLRQFRFDNLPNNRLFSIRNRVADGLRDQAESDLRRIKQSYEGTARP